MNRCCSYQAEIRSDTQVDWRSHRVQPSRLAPCPEGLPEATRQLVALRRGSLLRVLCLDRAEIWHLTRLIAGDSGPACQLTAWGGRARAGRELRRGWDSAAWPWHTGGRHRAYVGKVHSQNSEVRRFSLSPGIDPSSAKVKRSSCASKAFKMKIPTAAYQRRYDSRRDMGRFELFRRTWKRTDLRCDPSKMRSALTEAL